MAASRGKAISANSSTVKRRPSIESSNQSALYDTRPPAHKETLSRLFAEALFQRSQSAGQHFMAIIKNHSDDGLLKLA
jgi:hypothetical protein